MIYPKPHVPETVLFTNMSAKKKKKKPNPPMRFIFHIKVLILYFGLQFVKKATKNSIDLHLYQVITELTQIPYILLLVLAKPIIQVKSCFPVF